MKVCYSRSETQSPHERAYASDSQMFPSHGKEYDVHAMSVYDGVTFLLSVDDNDTPTFKPRSLFQVSDPSVTDDWIANTFCDGPVQLVVGPQFIASDLLAYGAMVDSEWRVVEQLWKRIDAMKRVETPE